jgi:predicted ATPase/DNA-binding XRE family transcriptional regulator
MGDAQTPAFGAVLRRLREAASLSQEGLAERAGLSTNAISALERGERRRPYPHTVRALADALGLDAADREALTGAVPRPRPAPTGASPAVPVSRLPDPPTPLVGRTADLAAVTAALGVGARLLTLIGPGGIGKTRLALAVAAQAAPAFPGGPVFLPLASLTDPALFLATLGAALGVRADDEGALAATLGAALRARQPLLLLDNCEHLLPALAPAIGALLRDCPGLVILATSRAPLRVHGERTWPVAPLALPQLDHLPDLGGIAGSPAVQLFLQRAVAVRPGFAPTAANAATLAAICRRLDGLPLALELAASWLRLLTPTTLLARLDRALPLLAGGARDLPARQRTLRDTIAWSHDLLAPAERRLFRRLAAFAGGWTLDAATAVTIDHARDDRMPDVDALGGLAALLDASLIGRAPVPPADDAEPRFVMLETIRAYALERLAQEPSGAGEEAATRDRHAAYYLALAERAEPELFRADQRAWLDLLGDERANLRAALGWFLARGQAGSAARIGAALGQYWAIRGPIEEGRDWLTRALNAGTTRDARITARAKQALATLDTTQARFASAAAHSAAALPLARAAGDRQTVAAALAMLGYAAAILDGDIARSTAQLEESAAISRELGQGWAVGSTLFGMAMAALRLGDRSRAAELLPVCAAALRTAGSWWYLAGCLLTEAQLALDTGESARAATLCREAIGLSRRLGDAVALPHMLAGLASARAQMGQAARAARLFGAAEALLAQNGAAIEVMAAREAHERYLALARAGLSPDDFRVAWEAGQALSPEVAIATALDEPASSSPGRVSPPP